MCIFKNKKCMTQSTLHPNEYTQGLLYYPFAFNLDVLEVVKLLMTYLITYVLQTKNKISM